MVNRASLKAHPNIGNLSTPNILDTLPEWARVALKNAPAPGVIRDPVTDAELEHINSWPNKHKEQVRLALAEAINNDRVVEFFWELYRGQSEHIVVDIPAEGGDIHITFYSPYDNVIQATGNIEVKVG
jgi:hypothetical protein